MGNIECPIDGTFNVVKVALCAAVQPRNVIVSVKCMASTFLSLQVLRRSSHLVFFSTNYGTAITFLSIKSALAWNFKLFRDNLALIF